MSAAQKLAGEIGAETATLEPRRARERSDRFDLFGAANDIRTVDVAEWLGLMDGDQPRCPHCKETDTAVAFVRGGLKCLHERCASKGVPGKPGFRTNVDLVMEVRELGNAEAALAVCERFGIDVPKQSRAENDLQDDDAEMSPFGPGDDVGEPPEWMDDDQVADSATCLEEPSAAEPLRGLRHLGAVALVGRERILELAAKPIEYVWVDVAPPGTVTLIAGPPADGKTTLLFLILGARANLEAPISLLDRDIRPAPPSQFLVLIEGEHSEASTARKLVKSLRLLGVDDLALERVVIAARKAVKLGSPEWVDVVTMIRTGLVSDIGIDTVARIAVGDSDSEREQVAIFEGVARAIESAPAGVQPPNVWAVAHTRKNNTTGELADVSGSVQRVGQSDTVLLMKAERADGRVVSTRVVFAKLREDPDEYPAPAEIVIRDGVLTSGAVPGAPADDRPLEDRILEALATGPKTKSAISKLMKRNKDDLEPAFTSLFSTRAITTTTVAIRGRDYTAFELRTTPYPTPYPDHAVPTQDVTTDEAEPC